MYLHMYINYAYTYTHVRRLYVVVRNYIYVHTVNEMVELLKAAINNKIKSLALLVHTLTACYFKV